MKNHHSAAALACIATVSLAISGCDKAEKADPAAVANAIKADQQKWNEQLKAKDQEGILSHYADDAFLAAPGAPPASGSTAIRKEYAGALADHYFSLDFAADKVDVASSGDLAYARGHFTEKHQDPKSHQIVTQSGSYLTVYKKQPDGSWKAVEDVAAADPATRKEASPVTKGPRMITLGI